jgi:hypothetical protein
MDDPSVEQLQYPSEEQLQRYDVQRREILAIFSAAEADKTLIPALGLRLNEALSDPALPHDYRFRYRASSTYSVPRTRRSLNWPARSFTILRGLCRLQGCRQRKPTRPLKNGMVLLRGLRWLSRSRERRGKLVTRSIRPVFMRETHGLDDC